MPDSRSLFAAVRNCLVPLRDHEAITALDALESQLGVCHTALALAAADLPCSNGCGCEEYDYCAQDECRKALADA